MSAIQEKDVEFTVMLVILFRACRFRENCLFGNFVETIAGDSCQIVLTSEMRVIPRGKGIAIRGKKIECPVFQFVKKLHQSSSFFLVWRAIKKYWEQETGQKPKLNDFFQVLTDGVGTLYSANERRFPPISETLIQGMLKKAEENPKKFFNRAEKRLQRELGSWFEEFSELARKYEITGHFWKWAVLLLTIFLEAETILKEPLPTSEEAVSIAEALLLKHPRKGRM